MHDKSATQMSAQGENIHFAPGEYNPNTQSGQELLGHELTHVVQQRAGRVKPDAQQGKGGMNINSDKSLENEADVMGAKAAQGKDASMVSGKGSGVQRKGDERLTSIPNYMERIGIVSTEYTYSTGKGGMVDAVQTIEIPASSDPLCWLNIFKSQDISHQSAIAQFINLANGDIKPGEYKIGKTSYKIDRNVSTSEKEALIKALFNPKKDLERADFDGQFLIWLDDYNHKALDKPLSSFIIKNYGTIERFYDETENSAFDASSNLASETTNSGDNTTEVKGYQKGRNGQKRGMAIYGDKMPPVTEALVSSAYIRAIEYTGEILDSFFTSNPIEVHEPIENSVEIINGALSGYKGKINSVNKRNEAIFDTIWQLIPLNGAKFVSTLAGNSYTLFISQVGKSLKEGLKSSPIKSRKGLTESFNTEVDIMIQKIVDLKEEAPKGAITSLQNVKRAFSELNNRFDID